MSTVFTIIFDEDGFFYVILSSPRQKRYTYLYIGVPFREIEKEKFLHKNAELQVIVMETGNLGKIKLLALAILTAAVIFCGVFLLTSHSVKEPVIALTTTTSSGEILLNGTTGAADSDGNVFNSESLSKLYKALGGEGATYNSLYKNVVTGGSNKTSDDFRKNNASSSSVIVRLGGQDFYAMYLTKDKKNKDLVLTLWATSDYVDTSCKFNDIYSVATTGNYPSSMYGICKLRASLLSGDGNTRQYWKGNTTSTPGSLGNTMSSATSLGNKFKLYTRSSDNGGIKDYLLTPSEIA